MLLDDDDVVIARASCSLILSTSLLICHFANETKRHRRVYYLQLRICVLWFELKSDYQHSVSFRNCPVNRTSFKLSS